MSSLYRASRLGSPSRDATAFVSSFEDDKRIFECVVEINRAHVTMLARRRLVSREHARKILRALARLRTVPKASKAEDIHVAIEEAVIKSAGKSAGGNLQLAKSRNDQVATAIRMRLRSELLKTIDSLIQLLAALQKAIGKHCATIMIGRTHLQPAEPVTYGHYLMAFHDAVLRDLERLEQFYGRLNLSPMGACALAGTSIPIDRQLVADLLGFDDIVENSLDAVGSRDFVLEFLADMAQLGVDISRLAEDLVLYATPEIRQIELPRDLSFTSSIMPQKRNPDVVELLRAKSALPAGALCHVITVLHSLPTSYNLDLQEITRDIWISSRTIQEEVNMLSLLLARAKASQADESPTYAALITATEMANLLVAEFRVPFRLAHRIVASAASRLSEDTGKATKSWLELVVQEARNKLGDRSQRLEGVLAGMATPKAVVASKRSVGSPRPAETARLLRRRITALRQVRSRQAARRGRIVAAQRRLRTEVRRVCS